MSSKESMCHNQKDLTANQHHYEYIKIIFFRILKFKKLFFLVSDHGAQGKCNFLLYTATPGVSSMCMNINPGPFLVYFLYFLSLN